MPMGEFEMIERLLRPLAQGYPGALDLTDDAALVDVPDGQQLVIAKDGMVEGVHFLPDDPPDLIAGKPGQFDVIVDGKVIFSKHEEGRFPDEEEIVRAMPG